MKRMGFPSAMQFGSLLTLRAMRGLHAPIRSLAKTLNGCARP